MGTDLRLANKIWRAAQHFAKSINHTIERVDYYTTVMTVAALLEDKELCHELYIQAHVKQKSDEELRQEAERNVLEGVSQTIEDGVAEAKAWVKGDVEEETVKAAFELLEEYSMLSPHDSVRCSISAGCVCGMPDLKERAGNLIENWHRKQKEENRFALDMK